MPIFDPRKWSSTFDHQSLALLLRTVAAFVSNDYRFNSYEQSSIRVTESKDLYTQGGFWGAIHRKVVGQWGRLNKVCRVQETRVYLSVRGVCSTCNVFRKPVGTNFAVVESRCGAPRRKLARTLGKLDIGLLLPPWSVPTSVIPCCPLGSPGRLARPLSRGNAAVTRGVVGRLFETKARSSSSSVGVGRGVVIWFPAMIFWASARLVRVACGYRNLQGCTKHAWEGRLTSVEKSFRGVASMALIVSLLLGCATTRASH